MRPSEPSIREELRREAARVQVPTDMWANISSRMDEENARNEARLRRVSPHEKWKPFFAFAAAAGVFWLTVAPLGNHSEASHSSIPAVPNSSLVTTIESDAWGFRQAQAMRYRTESTRDSSGIDTQLPGSQRVYHMYVSSY